MSRIIFVTNINGDKEVKEHIKEIVEITNSGNKDYEALAFYIAQALYYLKDIIIPKRDNYYLLGWNTHDYQEPDRPLTFHIVKKTISQPSVFEFRINWGKLYFRALFFVDDLNEEQYKFFTRSLLKKEKNPPELQQKKMKQNLLRQCIKLIPQHI